jgi:hypothetical protein
VDRSVGLDATAVDAPGVDAAPSGPQRLLVTFAAAQTAELVAVNVLAKSVDGRLGFAGFGSTDTRNTTSPFLLEQNADVVAKLDSVSPWMVDATWNVEGTDGPDGGPLYAADPVQVVEVGTKAYVLRYNRNELAVINDAAGLEGGTQTSTIDLSSFVQSGDADGLVEMAAAVYVPSTQRLYVALANINQVEEAAYGGTVVCSGEVSTVIAIDTLTDSLVSLNGTGPAGSLALTYFDPMSVVYDSVENRLLVVGAGCYGAPTAGTDGGLGPAVQRGVEAVDLATGASTSLLELSASAFPVGFNDTPTGFAYIDATHAVLGFDSTGQAVYMWDPTGGTLGSLIPNAPDVFTYDGNGNLLGTRVDTSDAGVASVTSTDVVSVTVPGGVSTTLGTNVTSLVGLTYVASVNIWPHP